jgi:hypothetical protein
MTMKMKAQKDDALNVATIHLLAMKIETQATVKYFQSRKSLKELLAILRQASALLDQFTLIADKECDPMECEPWVCCRGNCEFDCSQSDADRAAAVKKRKSRS